VRKSWTTTIALFALLIGASCTSGGGKSGDARASTSSSTTARPSTTTTVDPKSPREFTYDRQLEPFLKWTYKAYVEGEGTAARYCVQLTLTFGYSTDQRATCGIDRGLDLFEGPTVNEVSTYFGTASRGTARVRLADKLDRVVDVLPDALGAFDFRAYVAIVPSGYRMTGAAGYDGGGRQLRTTTVHPVTTP